MQYKHCNFRFGLTDDFGNFISSIWTINCPTLKNLIYAINDYGDQIELITIL